MVDEDLTKRAIESLNTGIAIQDLASSENVEVLDILHLTKKVEDKTLERVIMKMKDKTEALVAGGEFT